MGYNFYWTVFQELLEFKERKTAHAAELFRDRSNVCNG